MAPQPLPPRRRAPLAVGLMALALTLYLAYESSELHTAQGALREHAALVQEQLQHKLFLAWKKVRYEKVLGNSVQLDDYQKLIDTAHDLIDKRKAVQAELVGASQLNLVPAFVWTGLDALHLLPREQLDAGEDVPAASAYDALSKTCADAARTASVVQTKLQRGAPATSPLQDLDLYQTDYACFLFALNIDPETLRIPAWSAVFDTREKVNLLGSWLLPGIYGLLGACFFLMRAMMQAAPSVAPAAGTIPALTAVDILLRIAAGGLAGIIVGWFSVPAQAVEPAGGASTLSFGIAFLAGFSTDALFALLDKLLQTISKGPG